jgi:hypothetical protein
MRIEARPRSVGDGDALKRAAVLRHWLFQETGKPEEVLRAVGELLGAAR